MKCACVWTTCNKPLNLSNVRRLDMTLPHCSYQYMQCKISIFTSNFAGILGRKMANLMTGKSTTTEFRNNRAEERWSSLHPEMKILVSFHKSFHHMSITNPESTNTDFFFLHENEFVYSYLSNKREFTSEKCELCQNW